MDTLLVAYEKHYLSSSAYKDYPIVGITYQQAKKYTKWRSDRVFESILQGNGFIKTDSMPENEIFTIEYFYSNEKYSSYHNVMYPSYSFPQIQNFDNYVVFADSLNRSNVSKCKQRSLFYKLGTKDVYCDELIRDKVCIVNSNNDYKFRRDSKDYGPEPLVPVKCYKCKKKYPMLLHLNGNVTEFSADSNTTLGGSWRNTQLEMNSNTGFPQEGSNCWTGFRNVCEWKSYSNKKNTHTRNRQLERPLD